MTTTSAMDSRHGSSLEWCSYGSANTTGRSACGIRPASPYRSSSPAEDPQLQDADQLVHRRGRPGPAADHQVIGGAADRIPDDPAGLLAQPGGRQPSPGALGMGVGVPRQHRIADEILDEVQRPAEGGVIGVGDRRGPNGPSCSSPSPITPRRICSTSGDVTICGTRGPAGICPAIAIAASASVSGRWPSRQPRFGLDSLSRSARARWCCRELSGSGQDRQRRALGPIGGAFLALAGLVIVSYALREAREIFLAGP
jgi:hypothetical protein